MAEDLEGKKVAILATEGFEEVELTEPRKALEEAGADTDIVAPQSDTIRAWDHTNWGDTYEVDTPLDNASAEDYDALMMPGGVLNPDKLRTNNKAVEFSKQFMREGKPVAAICHGPWTLVETGELENRKVTSYHSIKTDLENAGANWVDKEVVVDQGLTTSRNPDDIPAFNNKMIEEFREGVHEQMATH